MSRIRITTLGCALLLVGALSGCGGASNTNEPPPPAADRPDAGLEASRSLMQSRPDAPAGKKGARP